MPIERTENRARRQQEQQEMAGKMRRTVESEIQTTTRVVAAVDGDFILGDLRWIVGATEDMPDDATVTVQHTGRSMQATFVTMAISSTEITKEAGGEVNER